MENLSLKSLKWMNQEFSHLLRACHSVPNMVSITLSSLQRGI
ncbi:hypothetical protein HID58_049972 [Brassica napus]|uniref:Uncharacterized protein n=1 Tax=Brassica napus TaxID=3708 RepID=A0ABQ8B6I6_BRANA|nr:hypothetical protein HID58_095563 [Brassica napus]KAH0900404.1 hypothetical protein HID58_049972 [Brassica napus]